MKTPEHFCFNPSNVKAFVLGCDPTNFSDYGNSVPLNFVFGIGQDHRYFKDILANLNLIGIHLEDVYIQNMITRYLKEETGRNKEWEKIAEEFLLQRKEEFNKIDLSHLVPVFLTAEILYMFLLNSDQKRQKPADIYEYTLIPIDSKCNKLERPLIPLFRNSKYKLSNWETYLKKLKDLL